MRFRAPGIRIRCIPIGASVASVHDDPLTGLPRMTSPLSPAQIPRLQWIANRRSLYRSEGFEPAAGTGFRNMALLITMFCRTCSI